MLGQFTPGLLNQFLKRNSLLEETPLQRPGADAQFESNIFQPWLLSGQYSLQNSLYLFSRRLVGELPRQFVVQLRRQHFKDFRVVRQEGLVQDIAAKDHLVVPYPEFYRTPKMILI